MKMLGAVLFLIFSLSAHAADQPSDKDMEEFRQFQEFKKMKDKKAGEAAPARSSGEISYSQLSPEERKIVDRGEISQGAYIGGGVTGTLLGLGIGQAVQGRYTDTGWIFTLGEVGSLTMMLAGAANCLGDAVSDGISSGLSGTQTTTHHCNDSLVAIGLVGMVGFRVWELIDLWAAPPAHNERYRNLKERMGDKNLSFYLAPDFSDPRGGDFRGGLVFRF